MLLTLRLALAVATATFIFACGDDEDPPFPSGPGPRDAMTEPEDEDAGADDGGACPRGVGEGTLELDVRIEPGVRGDVRIWRGANNAGEAVTESSTQTLAPGEYRIDARRTRATSDSVGAAYQGVVAGAAVVCISAGETTKARVNYTREPGSARLWLTQSNGSGTQVMAFDADQLAELGDQTPSVSLSPNLPNAGAIRVDGRGRLWVGTTTGKLVAFNTARLGNTSIGAPDIELEGRAICEDIVPCGPRTIAFDAAGSLWVATTRRIVKLEANTINRSGQPPAAVTIDSDDVGTPRGLAFDRQGNLWVASASGAVVKFDAERLTRDIDTRADVVIYARQPGPVEAILGEPEGMVFDPAGNLWVGYFSANRLVRFTPEELAESADERVPTTHIELGVSTLLTDLSLDEGGNLWMPGASGSLYRIASDQLSMAAPAVESLRSAEIGSVEKITLNTVPGPTFIAP